MKFLVSGYYGFGNAGDELILRALIADIRGRCSDSEITVLSAVPRATAAHHGVAAVNRWDFRAVLRALRHTQVLVSGGGGLFQDMTGNSSLYYYLALIGLARLCRKKIYLYSVGVNEVRPYNRRLTGRIVNMADRITVRDRESYDLLRAWGVAAARMTVTADPVLAVSAVPAVERRQQPRMVMILRQPRGNGWSALDFARAADHLTHRSGGAVLFVPFQHCDTAFMQEVQKAMHTNSRLQAWKDPAELVRLIGSADFVVSQRLHGLILAAVQGRPFAGISDDPKLHRFLAELGQRPLPVAAEHGPAALCSGILDRWERRESIARTVTTALPELQARARETARCLFS